MPQGPHVEERETVPAEVAERPAVEETMGKRTAEIGRRRFLGRLAGFALAALGVAAVLPIRSLGTRPGRSLFQTAWHAGARLVRSNGSLVRASDVAVDSILTVFPEGHTEDGDAPAVLIRLSGGGLVAYSKLCTHAGCPVGLYQAETKQLFCPCHQSVFAMTEGARPTSGPATRPLPSLPIATSSDGYLVATGDFSAPVGPGFWNRDRHA
jgi:ubiquinol-cytochrome c reductase iron-sulfur subunit